MRAIGQRRTGLFPWVTWYPTTAESTGLASSQLDLVAFALSFNVVKQDKALAESWRLLRPGGWFTCLWNYRDLSDPLQHEIESTIRSLLPNYEYGNRRQDQTATIQASGLFGMTETVESFHVRRVNRSDWLDAWKSHATLRRQAGDRFPVVLEAINALLGCEPGEILEVRYVTRAWLAQKRLSGALCL